MTEVADPIPTPPILDAGSGQGERPLGFGRAIAFPLVLRLPDSMSLDDDQFMAFCQQNETLRIERDARGDLVIMPPAGGETGNRNFRLVVSFGTWVEQDGTGEGFDSSTGFKLPNGADRSPDLAWVLKERLDTLTPEQTEKFIPLCPDFVLELRSPTDRLRSLQDKMQEYIDNGARLGWLIDPQNRHVYRYRPNIEVELLEDPATVSGDPILPGFVIDAQSIFNRRLGKG
jgi:Uma2 family endonuclease